MPYIEYYQYVKFIARNPYVFNLSRPEKKKKKDKEGGSTPEAPPIRHRAEDFPAPKPLTKEQLAGSPFVKGLSKE